MKIMVRYEAERNFAYYKAEIATVELEDMKMYPGKPGHSDKYEVNGANVPKDAYEFLDRIVKEAYLGNSSALVDLVDGRAYLNGTEVIR